MLFGAVPKDECIYLQGSPDVRYTTLTYSDFIGKSYESIMQDFIVISTVHYLELVFKLRKTIGY